MGLWLRRTAQQRRVNSLGVPRHSTGPGIPRLSGPHGERDHLAFARCREEHRHEAYGVVCHVAGLKREWPLFRASRIALLHSGEDRERPGDQLSPAQGHDSRGSRALARPESELRAGVTSGKMSSRSISAVETSRPKQPGNSFPAALAGAVTGIGSLPSLSAEEAVNAVAAFCAEAPFWPQLPRLSEQEGVIGQGLGILGSLVEPRSEGYGYEVKLGK